ncbi:MAG: sigma factor-like helix-turn-helix DNA-binding protein, partial [Acidobacteriota bacterium]
VAEPVGPVRPSDVAGYAAALQRLPPLDREAVIARIQMQKSYENIALALGQPDAAAARAVVVAALIKLCEEMGS